MPIRKLSSETLGTINIAFHKYPASSGGLLSLFLCIIRCYEKEVQLSIHSPKRCAKSIKQLVGNPSKSKIPNCIKVDDSLSSKKATDVEEVDEFVVDQGYAWCVCAGATAAYFFIGLALSW